jgi:hypothetical protein
MSMRSWEEAGGRCKQTASLNREWGDSHLKTALWQEFVSYQSYQNTLHFLNAHVYMLYHSTIQHARRNIPPPAFLLQVIEALEDNAFTVGETISDIGEVVTRVMGRHMQVSLCRVYPEFRAERCGGTWRSSPPLF